MRPRTWIIRGAAGALGLGVIATGAVAAANAMDLSSEASTAAGAPVVATGVAESEPTSVRIADDGADAQSTPTPATAPTAVTPASPVTVASAPEPAAPPPPADSAASVGSVTSVASAD